MSSISQLFVLSGRGDTIISKEFRGDIPKTTAETFFRKVKFWKGEAPPVFVRPARLPFIARARARNIRADPVLLRARARVHPPPPLPRTWTVSTTSL